MTEHESTLSDLGPVGERIANSQSKLRSGGPPVDEAALLHYIADVLDPASKALIGTQVVTWKAWNAAFWQTQMELSLAEKLDISTATSSGEFGPDLDQDPAHSAPAAQRNDAFPGAEPSINSQDATFSRVLRPEESPPIADAVGDVRRPRRWKTRRVLGVTVTVAAVLAAVVIFFPREKSSPVLIAQLDDPLGPIGRTVSGEVAGLDNFPPDWRDSIAMMIRTEMASFPAGSVAELRYVRTSSQPSMYVRPVATVVASTTPVLEWRARGDSAKYRVRVYLEQNDDPLVESDNAIDVTQWKLTEPLDRGQIYTWEVVVYQDGQPFISDEPRPRFRILNEQDFAVIERARAESGGSHLVLAAVYLQYGLLDDARDELQKLADKNPGSELAQKLRDSLDHSR